MSTQSLASIATPTGSKIAHRMRWCGCGGDGEVVSTTYILKRAIKINGKRVSWRRIKGKSMTEEQELPIVMIDGSGRERKVWIHRLGLCVKRNSRRRRCLGSDD
ncbi:hypothetical protein L2E82_31300 [Cichorium intybus]|uniref:Uncharacterized protein n=1 Tax=Cichorium intybus TaxID=13427 RepID=A0ACB9D2Y1_CICIN|nr:hypothetical protein L2E82_31300 [Cichorium intybus]